MQRRVSPNVEAARTNSWVVHLAAAADVVYAELDAAKLWLETRGCTRVQTFDAGGTQAPAYVRDGFRCVVFRGTRKELDWMTDLLCFYWGSPPVHCGFHLGWNLVKKGVLAWLKAAPSNGIYGKWGGGKTSLLKFIETQAESRTHFFLGQSVVHRCP
jgi:hypothetical protein